MVEIECTAKLPLKVEEASDDEFDEAMALESKPWKHCQATMYALPKETSTAKVVCNQRSWVSNMGPPVRYPQSSTGLD